MSGCGQCAWRCARARAPVDALVAQVVGELHLAAVRQEGVQVLLKLRLRALRERQAGALRQVPHVLGLHRGCRRTCSHQRHPRARTEPGSAALRVCLETPPWCAALLAATGAATDVACANPPRRSSQHSWLSAARSWQNCPSHRKLMCSTY